LSTRYHSAQLPLPFLAEPPTITAVALHHTLTELLLFCGEACTSGRAASADDVSLTHVEMKELEHIVSSHCEIKRGQANSVELILGADVNGNPLPNPVNDELKQRVGTREGMEGCIYLRVLAC
jgi:hypothetical protein